MRPGTLSRVKTEQQAGVPIKAMPLLYRPIRTKPKCVKAGAIPQAADLNITEAGTRASGGPRLVMITKLEAGYFTHQLRFGRLNPPPNRVAS